MILSSIITPFRIYSEYNEQDRFKKDCNNFCDYEFISDKLRLPSFQFQRDASGYPINSWLRKSCVDFYNQIIPENEAKFLYVTTWTLQYSAAFISQKAKFTTTLGGGAYGRLNQTTLLTIGNKYRVKVVVVGKKISDGFTCALQLENGLFNYISNFSTIGTHVYEFTATATSLSLQSFIDANGDFIEVSEFYCYEVNEYSPDLGDVMLPNLFEIANIGAKDVVIHCGNNQTSSLPCGKYYIIMQSKINTSDDPVDPVISDTYFFSEVFVIKNFVPDQSPYVYIEWDNTCELQGVKFERLNCSYTNRLYIEGPITRPEYPYTEEVEEDGNQNTLPTFQKLEKEEIIIVPKAPEFIVDALAAMRLHESIRYYEPLRTGQEKIDISLNRIMVEKMSTDIDYIFLDCAANVSLKMVLEDRFVDTSCCVETEETPVDCEAEIDDTTFSISHAGSGFSIFGTMEPNIFFKIKIEYMGSVYILFTYYTSAQLSAGFIVPYASIPITPITLETMTVTLMPLSANCTYPDSATQNLTFGGEP